MDIKNISPIRYWYGPFEGFEARCQRRLMDDLGVDQAAAEVIFQLRGQVVELQSEIRLLEAELTAQAAGQQLRLAQNREARSEAIWIELDFRE